VLPRELSIHKSFIYRST